MSVYRKLIAAFVGLAVLLLNRHYGLDLEGTRKLSNRAFDRLFHAIGCVGLPECHLRARSMISIFQIALRTFAASALGRAVLLITVAIAVFVLSERLAYRRGYADASAMARQITKEAIYDFKSDADRARRNRRDCINAGGLYKFATDSCITPKS